MLRFTLSFVLTLLSLVVIAQPNPPGAASVVISEVFYDMPGTADSLEFIELTNPSDTNERSLSFHQFTEGIEFTFPGSVIVPPAGVVIVAKDSAAFRNAFGVSAYQWESGDLADNGELIVLRNNFNLPIDSVDYQTNLFWPEASGNGKSIVLCDISQPNTNSTYWEAAETNTGVIVDGTSIFSNPGTSCDNWVNISLIESINFSIYPNPNNGDFIVSLASMQNETELKLVNSLGEVVWRNRSINSEVSRVDLANQIPAGLYFLTILRENATSTQRLVILE